MKKLLIATTIAVALLGSQVFAETDPSRDIDEQWAAIDQSQQMQQKHMNMMQATMEKIQAADDPAVRKQLMHEHMQEMRTMMDMMGAAPGMGMMGATSGMGMMSGQMMAGHAQGKGMQHDGPMPMGEDGMAQCPQMKDMAKHHEHMTQKMAMMQKMMQQMVERDAAQEEAGNHEHE